MIRQIKNFYLSVLSLLIGMKVTMKNLFSPAVTLQYPSEKQPMKYNFRGMVDLIPKDCVICYQCIKICPTAALELAHKQTVVENKKDNVITKFTFNAELCCFCGLCEEICPTDAIYLNKMYEVSTFGHDELLNIDLMDPKKYKHLDPNYAEPPTKKEAKAQGVVPAVVEAQPETKAAGPAVQTAPSMNVPTAKQETNQEIKQGPKQEPKPEPSNPPSTN